MNLSLLKSGSQRFIEFWDMRFWESQYSHSNLNNSMLAKKQTKVHREFTVNPLIGGTFGHFQHGDVIKNMGAKAPARIVATMPTSKATTTTTTQTTTTTTTPTTTNQQQQHQQPHQQQHHYHQQQPEQHQQQQPQQQNSNNNNNNNNCLTLDKGMRAARHARVPRKTFHAEVRTGCPWLLGQLAIGAWREPRARRQH